MTTSTLTLTSFLLARIEEDEATARGAINPMNSSTDGRWRFEEVAYEGVWPRDADAEFSLEADSDWTAHATRHDPARVLAECEAKRRIVASLTQLTRPTVPRYVSDAMRFSLSQMALPYADHPDYDEAWRP